MRTVPEIQASTLTGSVRHVLDALLRRKKPEPVGNGLYYLLMPLSATLQALGNRPTVVVTAIAS
jgi:hypothetical protein